MKFSNTHIDTIIYGKYFVTASALQLIAQCSKFCFVYKFQKYSVVQNSVVQNFLQYFFPRPITCHRHCCRTVFRFWTNAPSRLIWTVACGFVDCDFVNWSTRTDRFLSMKINEICSETRVWCETRSFPNAKKNPKLKF